MTEKAQHSFAFRFMMLIIGLIVIIIAFMLMGHYINSPLPRLSDMEHEEAASLFAARENAYPLLLEAINALPETPEALAQPPEADVLNGELPVFYLEADHEMLKQYFEKLRPVFDHLRKAAERNTFFMPFKGANEIQEDSVLQSDALQDLLSLVTARARFALDYEQNSESFLAYFELRILLDKLMRQDLYHELPGPIAALHAFTPDDFRALNPGQQRRLLRFLKSLSSYHPDVETLLEATHYRADSQIFLPSPFAKERQIVTAKLNWQDKWRLRRGILFFLEKKEKYQEHIQQPGWNVKRKLKSFAEHTHLPTPQLILMNRIQGLGDFRYDYDCIILLLALEKFHWNTGVYPESLQQLVPGYVDSMPHDAWYDVPYGYRLTEGGYVLYSYGNNLEDDGGLYDVDGSGLIVNLEDDRVLLAPEKVSIN